MYSDDSKGLDFCMQSRYSVWTSGLVSSSVEGMHWFGWAGMAYSVQFSFTHTSPA